MIGGGFGTCIETCPEGSTVVPYSPEVNNRLLEATAQMTSNIVNGMISAHNLEQTPTTTTQTSQSNSTTFTLQLGIGAGPQGPAPSANATASSQAGSTVTVTAQSTGPIVTAVRNANDAIQVNLGQDLGGMRSPTVTNPQGAVLGQVRAANADNLAVGAADFARTKANDLAEKFYQKHFPGRSLPQALNRGLGDRVFNDKRF